MTIEISNFYRMKPMEQCEHLRMNMKNIPEKIIKECELEKTTGNGWVYIEIRKVACGLPQAGMLVNDLLEERLKLARRYPTITTHSLWRHQSRPIIVALVVDDFGV